MPKLLRDAHFVLERYAAPPFIRLARTALPLRNCAQAFTSLRACRAALSALDPAQLGILVDWRLSPSAADPALQCEVALAVAAFTEPFARKAVLLLAPKGEVRSVRSEHSWAGSALRVFLDEEAAIAHVSSADR